MKTAATLPRNLAAIAFGTIGLGLTAVGAARADEPDTGTFSLVIENDLFYDTDRHYTNGVRLSWISPEGDIPDWVREGARRFPLFPDGGRVRASFAVGQSMYTPPDITLENPPLDERPYAGWLYGSVGLVAETEAQLDQLELSVGIVGPASLADKTQKIVHEITGSDNPLGWDTQLENEPGIVLTYQRSWHGFVPKPVLGLGFDATPHAGGALGNVFTYANAGLTLRFGDHLPREYSGLPRVQPSLPGSGFFGRQDGFGWYVFAGVEGRAVARNIFLDGNTFSDSRRVDKEPFVGDLQFGIALTWQDFRISYTHVVRTREFEGQDEGDNFGAFSVSARF